MSKAHAARNPVLQRACQIVREACGVRVPDAGGGLSRAALRLAASRIGVSDLDLLQRAEAGDARATGALVEAFLVHETSFHRHPSHFVALRRELGARGSDPVRIWCAGCATGEEAYSIAATCHGLPRIAPRMLWATDVSRAALTRAERGVYGAWSLRGVDNPTRARVFTAADGEFRVRGDFRDLVSFEHHNLLTDAAPVGDFSFVFCRNVLIYFGAADAARVLRQLLASLRPGGVLFVAPADLAIVLAAGATLGTLHGVPVVLGTPPRVPSAASVGPDPATLVEPGRIRVQGVAGRADQARAPLAAALEAARSGDRGAARQLTQAVLEGCSPSATAFLLDASLRDLEGDIAGALDAAERALYLAPESPVVHATLVPLLERLGRRPDAEQRRRAALALLEGRRSDDILDGVEPVSVGALKRALKATTDDSAAR